ncbi:MAG: N-acetyltransferase [Acidobacteria bacterium]|nr:N-acetyltransferase [Acidobacteriota bacterium]
MAEAEAVPHVEAGEVGSYRVRKARLGDVGEMCRIINHYAERQLMLPKTHLQIYENLRDYSVVTDEGPAGAVLACGALHIYWEDLAEVRAVAVDPALGGRGAGTALVEKLMREAREIGIGKAFVFTYVPDFFSRFGFVEVEHSAMPLKVYNECFHCPKFNKCDEIAMVVHL